MNRPKRALLATIRCITLALAALAPAGCITLSGPRTGPWTEDDRDFFHYTTQGSRLLRRDWFLALERHDTTDLFAADGLARFGYLPGSVGPRNPDGLPVGFAADPPLTREWIGMTCAACHVSEVAYRGTRMRVEGGPASADMYEFLAKLDLALRKAANDEQAFLRFARRVLGAQDSDEKRSVLRAALAEGSAEFARFVRRSTPASPWGPARLDAFGMIFNRVTSIDLHIDGNSEAPDAPVSYPFLWGTSWHEWTQWSGAVRNDSELRRLGRNVGQVLGVFGTLDASHGPTYASSAHRLNLLELERAVARLTAPEWPSALLGPPDPDRAARGHLLYRDNCSQCHHLVPKDRQLETARVAIVRVEKVGTDDTVARKSVERRSRTGALEGRAVNLLVPGVRMGPEESAVDVLSHVVQRAVLHGFLFGSEEAPPAHVSAHGLLVEGEKRKQMSYKARPLNGVWATGPFLHNGSVRTIYQLLLPPDRREAKFFVGGRELDPVEVGFANVPGTIAFELDTRLPGNGNGGHVYGTGLTEDQRRDLVEYIKTL